MFNILALQWIYMKWSGLGVGEYYHIYNRGVEKRSLFLDDRDRWRFMTLLIGFQGEEILNPMKRIVKLVQNQKFNDEVFGEILKNRHVRLIAFCLMPNHFHLIAQEVKEGGISKYMQRLANSYTKYFNTRYDRSGHLFGGRFHRRHIDTNNYLRHLSAYLHANPRELKKWRDNEVNYSWSSFRDYIDENRWGNFLNPEIILGQFDTGNEYHEFVVKTPLKKLEGALAVEH